MPGPVAFPPPGRSRANGYALILVLIGVAVLSLIAGTIALVSTGSASRFANNMLRAQLQCAVQAGVAQAIVSLTDTRPAAQFPTDGTPKNMSYRGIPVTVSAENEMGKIDLNGADETLLTGLFVATGQDKSAADTYAEQILDWRAPGNLKRLNGAKAADYQAAGMAYRPRGGPFQTVDELRLVLGITPALFQQIAPFITIYSQVSTPQWQIAQPVVLQAMGMDQATIDVIMAARARAANTLADTSAGATQRQNIPGQPGTAFTISAHARQNGFQVNFTETIRYTGNPQNPYWILACDDLN